MKFFQFDSCSLHGLMIKSMRTLHKFGCNCQDTLKEFTIVYSLGFDPENSRIRCKA